ncbi:potassium channel family protein [Saccharothrix sp.]|uniref:potassium channel family protein n=1 Tax=Saccharothrix sp. TaxID=1873460 RepID=UPI002811A0ED|nr:potassium channel family protein [Saccharothrix sp.]
MGWLWTALGVALVLLALRDVFHTLFHPSVRGDLATLVMRVVWRSARRLDGRGASSSLSGPLGMAAVVATWGGLTAAGWTLIYFAQMPEGFSFASALDHPERSDLLDSLYLSLVTVTTLGFGDIVPTSPSLRLVAPLEALVGFFLLTAAVSWIVQIYPALTRRRVLALRLATLRSATSEHTDSVVDDIPPTTLLELADGLSRVRVDLIQYSATYYFRETSERLSLPMVLGYALDLADHALTSEHRGTRLAGTVLSRALDDLADGLREGFLRVDGDTRTVLHAYAIEQATPAAARRR